MSDRRKVIADRRYVIFLTFSVYRRRRLLDLDEPRRIVLRVLNHQLQSFAAKCVGFVLMPDHVHALLWLPEPERLETFVHGWKRMSSFDVRRWYAENAPHYFEDFGVGDKFWQPKSYPFHIDNETTLREKLEYMHLNPVRASLVDKPIDWPWSSAGWYLERRNVGVPIEWIG